MANSKYLVKDLNAKDESEKFKRVVIVRCHRLKEQGYHEREIKENLQDWRLKLKNEQEDLRDKVLWYLDKTCPETLYGQIGNLLNSDITEFQQQGKNSLKSKIHGILGMKVIKEYEEPFKHIMNDFEVFTNDAGSRDKNIIFVFESTLCNAFALQRRNSIKLIERNVIRKLLNEIRDRGLNVVLEENMLPEEILQRIDKFARNHTDKPKASSPLITELEKMRVSVDIIYKGSGDNKVLNLDKNVEEIARKLNWQNNAPASNKSFRTWIKKYSTQYGFLFW
jgi:hypothetical protein